MNDPILLDLPAEIVTGRLLLRPPRPGKGPVLFEALTESLPRLRHFPAALPWVAAERTLLSSAMATGIGKDAEAVNALVGWAVDHIAAARVALIIDAENAASRRDAGRCGFILEGTHRMNAAPPTAACCAASAEGCRWC